MKRPSSCLEDDHKAVYPAAKKTKCEDEHSSDTLLPLLPSPTINEGGTESVPNETAYRSVPLFSEDNTNIRVLKLLPKDAEGRLACELLVIPVGGPIHYRAVSYVWGEISHGRSIVVNKTPMTVRENLWQFLNQMNEESQEGYFWIDAICIDQCSIKERNHQVAMMGKIYSQAASVVVWLGVSGARHQCLLNARWQSVCWSSRIPPKHPILREFLCQFSDNEYWSRTWILQEYVLARRLVIRLGQHSLDEDTFCILWILHEPLGLEVVNSKTSWYELAAPSQLALTILEFRKKWRTRSGADPGPAYGPDGSTSLLDMICRLPVSKCLNPLDRVYALLSLVDSYEMEQYPIITDYSKSTHKLLLQLVVREYQQGKVTLSELQLLHRSSVRDRLCILARALRFEEPHKEVECVGREIANMSLESIRGFSLPQCVGFGP